MVDVLHLLAGSGLCLLVTARVRMLLGSLTSRSLWVALAVLGVAQILQVRAVYTAVELAAGRPGVAALMIHGLTVVAAAAALVLHSSVQPDRRLELDRRPIRWAVLSLTAMLAAFAAAPPASTPSALADRAEYYDGTLLTAFAWSVYLSYLAWALIAMGGTTRRLARQAQAGPLRTGLQVGALGLEIGLLYVALKVLMIVAWLAGTGPQYVRLDAVGEAVVLSISLFLIATGSTYELICARVASCQARFQRRRALKSLALLASDLRPDKAGHRYLLPAEGDHQRLIMHVVYIRDAQRDLRGYTDPSVTDVAVVAAREAGHDCEAAQVLAEAVQLQLAKRLMRRGARPGPSVTRTPSGGRDFDEEVHCLERLAAAYNHPFVRAYADCDDEAA